MIADANLVVAELGGVAVRTMEGVSVVLRKNVATLDATDLADLRTAFTAAYGLSDDRGYAFHAGLHGLPLPIYCQHGTSLFLPWHRAYLYFFERALTDALGRQREDPSLVVGLPWWDWTSAASHTNGLPDAYLPTQNGANNPLAAGPVTLSASDLACLSRRSRKDRVKFEFSGWFQAARPAVWVRSVMAAS
jgi:Common central domain of tyrosinase